jgi:hypothetical protein
LAMIDGDVARPFWMWNASSSGQFLNFAEACAREALAVAPRAPSLLSICVHERIAEPQ